MHTIKGSTKFPLNLPFAFLKPKNRVTKQHRHPQWIILFQCHPNSTFSISFSCFKFEF